MIHFY